MLPVLQRFGDANVDFVCHAFEMTKVCIHNIAVNALENRKDHGTVG